MRRWFALVLLVCLGLSSCNMPDQNVNVSTATPEPGLVATSVSGTLTAQPLPTLAIPTLAPSVTAIIPSPTPQPTLTELPAGPTSTAVATLTPAADDIAAALGEPDYRNPLDNGRGFGLGEPYDDDNVRIAVENGALSITGKDDNGWHSWRLTSPKLGDAYIEATVRTRNCSGDDLYGLVARAPDYESGKGYYFAFTCDGRYTLGKWVEQGISDMIDYTQNAAILAGSNQTNRIGIRMEGRKLGLYANGKLLQEIEDTSFEEAGYYGVFIAPNDTAGFTADYDQIAYWTLP